MRVKDKKQPGVCDCRGNRAEAAADFPAGAGGRIARESARVGARGSAGAGELDEVNGHRTALAEEKEPGSPRPARSGGGQVSQAGGGPRKTAGADGRTHRTTSAARKGRGGAGQRTREEGGRNSRAETCAEKHN